VSPPAERDTTAVSDRGWWHAVWALVLAVSAWALCPLVGAIAAIFLALSAKREIRETGGNEGEGLATAAIVVSAVHLAAAVMVLGYYLIVK